MSDKLSELLPCPFCGCTKVPKRQGNGIGDYWLECFDCGASTRLREDGAGMEKDWNRRASPAPAIPAVQWQPIETAPKETELLGWRADCGVMLIMYTSFDRWASQAECDEIDEETLFQMDWFGTALPGIMDRLEGEQMPTHWMPLPVDPTDDKPKAAPAISESDQVVVPTRVVELLRIINRDGLLKRATELQEVYRLIDAARKGEKS